MMLNPGGILNWKYRSVQRDRERKREDGRPDVVCAVESPACAFASVFFNTPILFSSFPSAETYLRASPLPYTILRPCGLVPEKAFGDEPSTGKLQAGQGDTITGRLTRQDLGLAVAAALASPYSAGKTMEIRRDEAADANAMTGVGRRPRTTAVTALELFQPLVADKDRAVSGTSGLFPFPEAVDPPQEVSPERAKEILNDPRVKAQQERDRALVESGALQKGQGGGGRIEEEPAAAVSMTASQGK